MTDDKRNPLFIPEATSRRPACPKCGHPEFTGRKVSGVVTFTCKSPSCQNKWQGGLPQEPQDPRIPLPTESYVPPVRFLKNSKGDYEELRSSPKTVQSFRTGAPIPREGEE
jgi:hypothetical protein